MRFCSVKTFTEKNHVNEVIFERECAHDSCRNNSGFRVNSKFRRVRGLGTLHSIILDIFTRHFRHQNQAEAEDPALDDVAADPLVGDLFIAAGGRRRSRHSRLRLRVGEDLVALAPHRPARALLTHVVLHGTGSLPIRYSDGRSGLAVSKAFVASRTEHTVERERLAICAPDRSILPRKRYRSEVP
jgi:hypothetical protein